MGNIARRPDGKWRARYRDASGRERTRQFVRKVDAQRWLSETTQALADGRYVDPRAGRITLHEYDHDWLARQVHRETTAEQMSGVVRRYIDPVLGDLRLAAIQPADVQRWVKTLSRTLAPSTVEVAHRILYGILKSPVSDRRIVSNPCVGTKLPKVTKPRVHPISEDQLAAIVQHMPRRHQALVILAAGTGLRQGEIFGLTIDRLDLERLTILVNPQLVNVSGREPFFGPPKSQASVRVVPLPGVVAHALEVHLRLFPTSSLVFANSVGAPLRRSAFWTEWNRALSQAGVPAIRFHELRHYYASLLIRHGESVKTVQARLGHASASETLDTYSHLWPDNDERTRAAVDGVLRNFADLLRTTGGDQTHHRRSET
ncbi:site-specific integrase [Terrabacter sp. NPDC000476]|uniref:tyrosine-type recombinase/integrase n=1 Tax=Terrabacter sp. NPDC000476 TaxID=3154258 RepID=UPI00331BA5B2